eukprot:2158127-Rhodomonas_salina.2
MAIQNGWLGHWYCNLGFLESDFADGALQLGFFSFLVSRRALKSRFFARGTEIWALARLISDVHTGFPARFKFCRLMHPLSATAAPGSSIHDLSTARRIARQPTTVALHTA